MKTISLDTEQPNSKEMTHEQMIYCCGIEILFDFGYASPSSVIYPTQEKIEQFINDYIHKCKNRGLVLAATSIQQIAAIAALKACSFTPLIDNWYNPNSSGRVTLWGKLINQTSAKKPKINAIEALEDVDA